MRSLAECRNGCLIAIDVRNRGRGASAGVIARLVRTCTLGRAIQYAAASRLNQRRLWNTGFPAFAGNDTGVNVYAAPINIPTASTIAPPSTIWNTAWRNGVSM